MRRLTLVRRRATRGVAAIGYDAAIGAAGWRTDAERENANLRLGMAIVIDQRDYLAEQLDAMTERALAAEHALTLAVARIGTRPRPSRPAAVWAALCLGWQTAWDLLETPESRERRDCEQPTT